LEEREENEKRLESLLKEVSLKESKLEWEQMETQ
jgi:hypothetical protein